MQSLVQLTYSCRQCTTARSVVLQANALRSKSTTSAIRAGLRAETSARTRSRYDGRTSSSINDASGRSSSGMREGRDRERPARRFNSRDGEAPRFGAASQRSNSNDSREPRFGATARRNSPYRDDGPRFGSPARRPGLTDNSGLRFRSATQRFTPKDDDDSRSGGTARRSRDDLSSERGFVTGPQHKSADGRPERESPVRAGTHGPYPGRARVDFDSLPQGTRPVATDANGFPLSRRERRAAFWEQKQTDDAEAELEEENDPQGSDDVAVAVADQVRPRSGRQKFELSNNHRRADRTGSPGLRSRTTLDDHDKIPTAIKYTTAASQFLYGANVVIAVLAANRRKIYHLYMHKRAEAENIAQIRRAATAQGIPITRTTDNDLMDRLSQGRPHNGVVLEVSPLPASPVATLSHVSKTSRMLRLMHGTQSAEDIAITGKNTTVALPEGRAPVVVFLDGINDPGNLGSIIRSAHFFGVDAVAIATQTCASLDSPIVAKASSGACEAMPLLAVAKAGSFIKQSADHGWTVCAAVAPEDPGRTAVDDTDAAHDSGESFSDNAPNPAANDIVFETVAGNMPSRETVQQLRAPAKLQQRMDTLQMLRDSLLADRPRLLMLGAEGEGLRRYLKERADVLLTISSGPKVASERDVGVDSMNVGVAAGILMNAMVSVARPAKDSRDTAKEPDHTVERSSEKTSDISQEIVEEGVVGKAP